MFYDRFMELCSSKGVKPTPLVLEMGLSSSNVSQWKKGSTPRPEVLKRIAEYFGVSVGYLIDVDGEKEKPPAHGGELSKDKLLKMVQETDDEEMLLEIMALVAERLKEKRGK